jgi:hypothetical protein
MCLFLTIETSDSGASRTSVKRVLKGASALSAYPADVEDRQLFYISNEPHCACDLHVAGPDALGAGIELDRGACESLDKIAGALASAGVMPFELRVFWADQPAVRVCEMDLAAFSLLIRSNSFDGGARYVVTAE